MRITIAMLLLSLVPAANVARAQQDYLTDRSPEERAALQTEYMAESLSLTDSVQISRVNEINLRYARENQAVLEGGGRKLARLRRLRALDDDKEQELMRVLTDEQFALYRKNREEMKREIRERAKERRSEGS